MLFLIITRSLRATPDIVLASTQFIGTFVLGAVVVAVRLGHSKRGSLGLIALAACVSVAALLCVNRSLKLAPASVVVPYQYSMIVWAVMFGYMVFGDVPAATTVIGAAIIIGAGIYIFWREQSSDARSLRSTRRCEGGSLKRPQTTRRANHFGLSEIVSSPSTQK